MDVADLVGVVYATERALRVFVDLAKAQLFEDGNKRTALFVANGVLIYAAQTLVVPTDDEDHFNDVLACAYIFDDDTPVIDLLRGRVEPGTR